jgi:hypothetical protein
VLVVRSGDAQGEGALPLTLSQAGKATGCNRATILRAVKAGKLSATYDETTGAWLLKPAELFRLYPALDAHASAARGDTHLWARPPTREAHPAEGQHRPAGLNSAAAGDA